MPSKYSNFITGKIIVQRRHMKKNCTVEYCKGCMYQLKCIFYIMVQRFSQVDPILILVLSKNLHISGRYSLITVLIFQYIDSNLPYLSYFEQIL